MSVARPAPLITYEVVETNDGTVAFRVRWWHMLARSNLSIRRSSDYTIRAVWPRADAQHDEWRGY